LFVYILKPGPGRANAAAQVLPAFTGVGGGHGRKVLPKKSLVSFGFNF
jgi:hypothetical protein